MLATFGAWLISLIQGVLVPLFEGIVSKMQIAQRVSSLEKQSTDTITAIGQLQSATTPAAIQAAIAAIQKSDNG